MPITVKHGPDLRLVGAAGLLAGYGQFQKDERDAELKAAQVADQIRRTNAGIFGDQLRAYEGAAQRQFLAGRELFEANTARDLQAERFQQQAALQESQQAQQQQLLQQRLQSNEEILERRAEQEYQDKVNESLQQFDWDPSQERELHRIDQALMAADSNPHWDESQRVSARRQLMRRKRDIVGYPKKPKQNPIQMFPAVDGTTGQPLTDSRGNPIKGFQNGTRTDIYEDPWIAAQAKAEADQRAEQAKAEAEERKRQADAEKEEIKRNAELEKSALDLAKESMKSLTQPDKMTGQVPEITPEAAASHLKTFDMLVAGFRQRLKPGGAPPPIGAPQATQLDRLHPILQDLIGSYMPAAASPETQQPAGWRPPMLPPEQDQSQPQSAPQQEQPQQGGEVLTSNRTGKQYTRAALEAAAAKAGMPIEQLLAQLGIQ